MEQCILKQGMSVFMAMAGAASIALSASRSASAEVVLLGQFSPGLGSLVGSGYDQSTDRVWVYKAFGTVLSSYSTAGVFIASIPRAGEMADDADIEIAPVDLMLSATAIPAGTLMLINGESGVAEIYAINSTTGAVMASLSTDFGVGHVVGGAYHPCRNTFFLIQDKVPGGTNANRVAEIDPSTGAVLNSFQTTPAFQVNYGDLDISTVTGNLFLVSSDESSIGEFTPTGAFVQDLPLPAGVSGLSGIGINDSTGEAWVSGNSGTVWHLGGLPMPCGEHLGDVNNDCIVNIADLLAVITSWGPCADACACAADIAPAPRGDGVVDVTDLLLVITNWS